LTGLPQYKVIEDVPGVSREILYSRFKIWVSKNFKSATDVIKLDDISNYIVHVKGMTEIYHDVKILGSNPGSDWYCFFMIQAYFKDNKYKIILDNFSYKNGFYEDQTFEQVHHRWKPDEIGRPAKSMRNNFVEAGLRMEARFHVYMENLLLNIHNGMVTATEIQKDDW
jgi:hypothetical protein